MNHITQDGTDKMLELHVDYIRQKYKAEIERAVVRVKNYKNRSTRDKWFRKKWFITQARDRKKRTAEKQCCNYGNSLRVEQIANRAVRSED